MKPEDIDQALALLAPIVSHEIRNPMAVIKNSSYFIKTKLGKLEVSDEKISRHLDIIETELIHANAVLEEILLYARMPEAKLSAHRLRSIVEAAISLCAFDERAKISALYPDEDPLVKADPDLAAKALRHFIRNAHEAGEGSLSIEVKSDSKRAFVRILDKGPGVPPEAKLRLFEPFNTTKPRGIGLGLAYAKKAFERMDALGALENGKGGETAFVVSFKASS